MRRRRRRGIKGNLGKVGLLCLALLLGMGSLTVGFPAWTDSLTISGTVTTGEWETCETGYAWGGDDAHCFSEYGLNNWGWSNGPLSPGSYEFEIHAGVGKQKDCPPPTEETLVGTLTVDYDGSTAIVAYNMDTGFTMKATHLYVGNDPLPTKNGKYTTAPGNYPYKHDPLNDVTTNTYTVTGLSGDIYVVAHAVVCGLFD